MSLECLITKQFSSRLFNCKHTSDSYRTYLYLSSTGALKDMRCFSMATVMCYVQVLFFKKLQKAVEHGGLIGKRAFLINLSYATGHMR